ncbi:MAG: hypothetical protein HY738_21505, partial [Bacteroidia bacterium]|nr:hypothetical protein [Bacteroidia bacterium]
MHKITLILIIAAFCLFSLSCDKDNENDEPDKTVIPDVLLIVESSKYNGLSSKLAEYQQDIAHGDTSALILQWSSGSVIALRDTIKRYYDKYHIKGAFLIGDIPAAWYEMDDSFDEYEEFPFDLFLMDPFAEWQDTDEDGKYDYYSSLELKLFTARLIGSESEINNYFSKVHNYRKGNLSLPARGYIFIDDDWASMYASEYFNVNTIFSITDRCIDVNETTKSAYLSKLTGQGAEYIHQMIHSYPNELLIYHQQQNESLGTQEITSN